MSQECHHCVVPEVTPSGPPCLPALTGGVPPPGWSPRSPGGWPLRPSSPDARSLQSPAVSKAGSKATLQRVQAPLGPDDGSGLGQGRWPLGWKQIEPRARGGPLPSFCRAVRKCDFSGWSVRTLPSTRSPSGVPGRGSLGSGSPGGPPFADALPPP